jgi:pyridoxine kinase
MTKNLIPRIVVVHDLSGLGKVALMVVIPILSSMGMQVNPLPTALLSASTNYPNFKMLDLTEQMRQFIEHWRQENIVFDAIYTGFLGSPAQIEIVKDLIKYFRKDEQLIVVDPVLGDDGKAYSTMDKQMIEGMKDLITHANLITPNITEACLLLDKEYRESFDIKTIEDFAIELTAKGPHTVIITGVNDLERKDTTSVIAYSKLSKQFHKVSCAYVPADFPGTGDIFASVITGSLLQGDSLPTAVDRAVNFTSKTINTTYEKDYNINEGVLFEKVLATPHLLENHRVGNL